MTTKSVLAIPYWLHEKLQRHQLPLASIDDPNKLSQVLSAEELASIYALNSMIRRSEPFKDDTSIEVLFDLQTPWRAKGADMEAMYFLSESQPVLQELLYRLHPDTKLDESDPNKGTIYKLVEAERAYCVLVIYPGFFESLAQPRFQLNLVRRLLEIFYVYFGAVKCFELWLFGEYIRQLSRLTKA